MSVHTGWYILRVASPSEVVILGHITDALRHAGLSDLVKDMRIFYEDRPKIVRGKKVNVKYNIMPGYLFIKMPYDQRLINIMSRVNGVYGFLKPDGVAEPSAISDEEIAGMLSVVEKEQSKVDSVHYVVGETVRIIDGPFSTFVGVLDEVFEKKQRVRVIVSIFGRPTPVELQYAQIEKE